MAKADTLNLTERRYKVQVTYRCGYSRVGLPGDALKDADVVKIFKEYNGNSSDSLPLYRANAWVGYDEIGLPHLASAGDEGAVLETVGTAWASNKIKAAVEAIRKRYALLIDKDGFEVLAKQLPELNQEIIVLRRLANALNDVLFGIHSQARLALEQSADAVLGVVTKSRCVNDVTAALKASTVDFETIKAVRAKLREMIRIEWEAQRLYAELRAIAGMTEPTMDIIRPIINQACEDLVNLSSSEAYRKILKKFPTEQQIRQAVKVSNTEPEPVETLAEKIQRNTELAAQLRELEAGTAAYEAQQALLEMHNRALDDFRQLQQDKMGEVVSVLFDGILSDLSDLEKCRKKLSNATVDRFEQSAQRTEGLMNVLNSIYSSLNNDGGLGNDLQGQLDSMLSAMAALRSEAIDNSSNIRAVSDLEARIAQIRESVEQSRSQTQEAVEAIEGMGDQSGFGIIIPTEAENADSDESGEFVELDSAEMFLTESDLEASESDAEAGPGVFMML